MQMDARVARLLEPVTERMLRFQGAPCQSLLRRLSRPTLIARTIPFIPAIRFIRLQNNF
jgi:hypothetical protein